MGLVDFDDGKISMREKEYWEFISEFFYIVGEHRLRTIVSDNPHADFILRNGNRIQIKRKIFEEYIDSIDEI